ATRAAAHFCVSRAMQSALAEWHVDAVVLYDRPAEVFTPGSAAARDEVFRRIILQREWETGQDRSHGRPNPAIIVSPTSSTPDEDFSFLRAARAHWEGGIDGDICDARRPFPPLLVLITGEGPLRAAFEGHLRRLSLSRICARTLWLS